MAPGACHQSLGMTDAQSQGRARRRPDVEHARPPCLGPGIAGAGGTTSRPDPSAHPAGGRPALAAHRAGQVFWRLPPVDVASASGRWRRRRQHQTLRNRQAVWPLPPAARPTRSSDSGSCGARSGRQRSRTALPATQISTSQPARPRPVEAAASAGLCRACAAGNCAARFIVQCSNDRRPSALWRARGPVRAAETGHRHEKPL